MDPEQLIGHHTVLLTVGLQPEHITHVPTVLNGNRANRREDDFSYQMYQSLDYNEVISKMKHLAINLDEKTEFLVYKVLHPSVNHNSSTSPATRDNRAAPPQRGQHSIRTSLNR